MAIWPITGLMPLPAAPSPPIRLIPGPTSYFRKIGSDFFPVYPRSVAQPTLQPSCFLSFLFPHPNAVSQGSCHFVAPPPQPHRTADLTPPDGQHLELATIVRPRSRTLEAFQILTRNRQDARRTPLLLLEGGRDHHSDSSYWHAGRAKRTTTKQRKLTCLVMVRQWL